jgi:hypothetical protein
MASDITIPRHHYDTLIRTAAALKAVALNAADTVLESSPYESMLRGPALALGAALENVPGTAPDTWDGTFREEDVTFTSFRHDTQPDWSGPSAGVNARHEPTGLSVESYMKPTPESNKRSALTALRGMVERQARGQARRP